MPVMIKAHVNQLLQKEMDRKDFLRHIGVAAAIVIGIPALLKALSQLQSGSATKSVSSFGYGSSPYGGNKSK
jgi:hypothetical protein